MDFDLEQLGFGSDVGVTGATAMPRHHASECRGSAVLPELLHGGETRAWGDPAYRGQWAVIR